MCFSSSALISANSASSREASPRFTLEIRAPIVHVIGSTAIDPRVPERMMAGVAVAVVMS